MLEKVVLNVRNIVIVGFYLSGKIILLESLLLIIKVIFCKGSVKDGNIIGDGSLEVCDCFMIVEINAVSIKYDGINFIFLDCFGFIEFV